MSIPLPFTQNALPDQVHLFVNVPVAQWPARAGGLRLWATRGPASVANYGLEHQIPDRFGDPAAQEQPIDQNEGQSRHREQLDMPG